MPRKVQIFTTSYCPYCVHAKALLLRRGIPFEEVDVTNDAGGRARLVQASGGRRTVPQIFIGGVPIGGSDELRELDRRGWLMPMIGVAA